MRILEVINYAGRFWLPDAPDTQISGMLKISDGGKIELELIGNFDGEHPSFDDDSMHVDRIFGLIEKEGAVILEDCFYRKKSFSFGGSARSVLFVHRAICGDFEKDEQVLIDEFRFSIEGLDEWLNRSGITVEWRPEEKACFVNFKAPDELAFSLPKNMTGFFTCGWTWPGGPIIREAKITQGAFVKFKSESSRPLDEFVDTAYAFARFISFAVDAPIALKEVTISSSSKRQSLGEKSYPLKMKLFYQSRPFAREIRAVEWPSMIFTFKEIEVNFETVINTWFAVFENLRPSLALYFSSLEGDHKHLDGRFLSLAQALESLHRRTRDGQLMLPADYEDLVAQILEKCPDSRKDWLQGRLKYGNEISFIARIKRLASEYKEYFGSASAISAFAKSLATTRNYLTHYNAELEDDAAKGRKLLALCMMMEVLLQLDVLRSLGFNREQIERMAGGQSSIKRKIIIARHNS